jgi:hypothetical protein
MAKANWQKVSGATMSSAIKRPPKPHGQPNDSRGVRGANRGLPAGAKLGRVF